MKNIKSFQILIAGLGLSFVLTAFVSIPKIAPEKIIVDDIIFITEGAGLVQDQSLETIKKLPETHQNVVNSNSVVWYDNNHGKEGYFVRIEEINGTQSTVKLDLKMVMNPSNQNVALYLPMVATETSIKGKPIKKTRRIALIRGKSGLTCRLTISNVGFKISNIKGGQINAQYKVTIFSKDNV